MDPTGLEKSIVKQFMDKIYTEPNDKQQYILRIKWEKVLNLFVMNLNSSQKQTRFY